MFTVKQLVESVGIAMPFDALQREFTNNSRVRIPSESSKQAKYADSETVMHRKCGKSLFQNALNQQYTSTLFNIY